MSIDRALRHARAILERAWTPERFRLELRKETIPTHRSLRRPIHCVELAVWERDGVAAVRLDRAGRVQGVQYPVARDDLPLDAEPLDAARVPEAAIRAALAGAAPGRQVREAARTLSRDDLTLWLTLEHRPPDGVVVVELEPGSGEPVGHRCEPFLRGSTRSGALSRTAVVRRARAAVDLPPQARLRRADLALTSGGARIWRLRWVIEDGPGGVSGFVRAVLNARTGAVAGLLRDLRPPLDDTARVPRDAAAQRLETFVRVRFGPDAEATPLVPGATLVGEDYRPAWLSVIRTRRRLIRATLVGERVELAQVPERRQSA